MRATALTPHRVGLMGGTGALSLLPANAQYVVNTPWGSPSSALAEVTVGQARQSEHAWMIARHGEPHRIPPHRVNYRANIQALKDAGVQHLIAINAVGGIYPDFEIGDLVLVDQIIDYTWGRDHTFSDGAEYPLEHIEFAQPFDGGTRTALIRAAQAAGVGLHLSGCYGATQGPRLETAAEIQRLKRDGCDVVGMTGMPEVALAREAGMDCACLCVIANPAAGLSTEPISMAALHQALAGGMAQVANVLNHLSVTG